MEGEVQVLYCPICPFESTVLETLQSHVEHAHFAEDNSGPNGSAEVPARPFGRHEALKNQRELSHHVDEKPRDGQPAKAKPRGLASFESRSNDAVMKEPRRGQPTVAEYHERRIMQRVAHRLGLDDNSTMTEDVPPCIRNSLRNSTVELCSALSHWSSNSGDRGWGCGYRNLQMLLSCLSKNPLYKKALEILLPEEHTSGLGKQGTTVPSILCLQSAIETAWQQGFDPEGRDQLQSSLRDTKKWIGATEIVALLSSLRIRCILVDFHKPTNPSDGTHPALFDWVRNYFAKRAEFKPPLYLQHQGHSRTIVGIERKKNTPGWSLLILDPGTSRTEMDKLKNQNSPALAAKVLRNPMGSLKHQQYQIVAVDGLLNDETEYQGAKILRSLRIPAS